MTAIGALRLLVQAGAKDDLGLGTAVEEPMDL
jgi:hypothetical protein